MDMTKDTKMKAILPTDEIFSKLVTTQTIPSEIISPNVKPHRNVVVSIYEHISFEDVTVLTQDEYYIGYNYKMEIVYFIIDVEHFEKFKKHNNEIKTITSISELPPLIFNVKHNEIKDSIEKIKTLGDFISKIKK